MNLYSHRNQPAPAQIVENFSDESWTCIVDLIKLHIITSSFSDAFGNIASNYQYNENTHFYTFVKAKSKIDLGNAIIFKEPINLITNNILDLIEVIYSMLNPNEALYRKYILDINKIFYEYGMIYEIENDGKIIRKLADNLVKLINQSNQYQFDDSELSSLIKQASSKFKSHIIEERKTSLEKLWDAFERIKTQLHSDKKQSVIKLISLSDASDKFKEIINDEMQTLTKIGNTFQIRHSETDKTPITQHAEIDYLFQRCLSLFNFLGTNLVSVQPD